MKKFILTLSILASFAASAAEMKVMEISASTAGRGGLTTKFKVNSDGTAGVEVEISKRTMGSHTPRIERRTFSQVVPELSLNGDTLELAIDNKVVNCGTMGVTSVFKLPVLRLSGNCDVVAKRVDRNVVVSIIAE